MHQHITAYSWHDLANIPLWSIDHVTEAWRVDDGQAQFDSVILNLHETFLNANSLRRSHLCQHSMTAMHIHNPIRYTSIVVKYVTWLVTASYRKIDGTLQNRVTCAHRSMSVHTCSVSHVQARCGRFPYSAHTAILEILDAYYATGSNASEIF